MNFKLYFHGIMAVSIMIGLVSNNLAQASGINAQSEQPIQLLYSGLDGASFELMTPEYRVEDIQTEAGAYQAFRVDGYGSTNHPGYPQLPTTGIMLGIPGDGEVEIAVTTDKVVSIPVREEISPVSESILREDGTGDIGFTYFTDPVVYQQNSFYPEIPVKVEEYGWLRDQHYVRIGLYPFQYNPTMGVVLWHKQITVQVQYLSDENPNNENTGLINIIDEDSVYEALVQNHILNYETARAWRVNPPVNAEHQTSVSGDRIRIVVKEDGLYQISYADLISAGMAGTDPRTFQMTNQGQDVAIIVVGEEDGTLDEGDYILFYGEAYRGDTMATWYADESQNWITFTQQLTDGTTALWHPDFNAAMMEKYNDENVYWLQSVSNTIPVRMQIVDGNPGVADVPAYYHTTAHAEIQWIRWEFHYTSEDTWFWRYVTDTSTQSFDTALSAIYTEPFTATVRSEYVAYTYSNLLSPDHHTVFHLNTSVDPINESYWDGRSRHSFEADIPSSDLIEGTNTLLFNIVEDDSVASRIFIDWFEIDYLRRFVAVNDRLAFPGEVTGTWRYQLEGFTHPDIQVYDISNAHQPIIIENINTYLDGTYRAEFQYTHNDGASFYAVGNSAIQTPTSVSHYTPPDLKSSSNGADYLIISHADFITTAQALADYRASQGLRVRIVDIEDLYNEFNEGIRHPIAIKNFLEYTFAQWTPPAPLYVVLVGDGHWDLLDTGYTTAAVYMPPNLSWVDPLQGEVDSSSLLASIVGDDLLPDLLIGRLPVNTPQELQNIIDKTIAFEQISHQGWQLNNTFIADNTPDAVGDFPALADSIISQYIEPVFTPIKIYEDDFGCSVYPCPAVTSAILDTVNVTGTLFATYIGHASVQNWSHERIFVVNNIGSLTNADRLPIILSMDCLDGYWFHPLTQPSMAETFLRTANFGAVATFSPTGLGVGLGHYNLLQGFFGTVYQDGIWELGAAALGAKIQLYNAGYFRDMLLTFTIFGDPALKLPSPYGLSVSPTTAEQWSSPGTQVNYTIQVSNIGMLTDIFNLTVEGNTWSTTLSSNILSLDPGESAEVDITIEIPYDILGGETDIAIIQIVSDGDVAEQQSVAINTVSIFRVHLPMMRK